MAGRPDPAGIDAGVGPAPESNGGRRAKILVVEDEPGIRSLLRRVLEEAGYAVAVATNGAAALAEIITEHPALILTDITMPVMNGRELVAEVRSSADTATIPIVVLSSETDIRLIGADAALAKPFKRDTLITTIRALIGSG